MHLEHLRKFATKRQLECLDAWDEHGTQSKAAKAIGIGKRRFESNIHALKARAAKQGVAPEFDMTREVPEPFYLKGTSTLYDRDGNPVQQWVKTNIDHERAMEVMREACEALAEDLPRYKPIKKPRLIRNNLANCYIVTDYHFGMMAWSEETGADWDLKIAEDLLYRWFERAIDSAPDAEVGILAELGDYVHFDSMIAVTPTHGHILDTDTRMQKLVRVVVRATRRIIDMMLRKYPKVHIKMVPGNHNPVGSVYLREMLAHVYEKEKRLTIDMAPDLYFCYEWGNTSLFFHHGHKRKPSNVSEVFAAKFREVFGRTRHSYGHMGHMHHIEVKENNLMVIEQHRTLAAADAHTASLGYAAGRGANVITYHKEYGEVGRISLTPDMVYK